MAESNVMLARKAHEVILSVENVIGSDDKTLLISLRSVVTGKIEPVLLIEGSQEELVELDLRLRKRLGLLDSPAPDTKEQKKALREELKAAKAEIERLSEMLLKGETYP